MRVWAITEGKSKPALFTPWSLVHVGSGAALCAALANRSVRHPFLWALAIHTIYEFKDFYISYVVVNDDEEDLEEDQDGDNSLLNSLGDTVAMVLGYMATNRFVAKEDTFLSAFPIPSRIVIGYAILVLVVIKIFPKWG